MSAENPKQGEEFAKACSFSLYPAHKRWLARKAEQMSRSESALIRLLIEAAMRQERK
jgi:hypothetical protein